jgi:hypothetical protein
MLTPSAVVHAKNLTAQSAMKTLKTQAEVRAKSYDRKMRDRNMWPQQKAFNFSVVVLKPLAR